MITCEFTAHGNICPDHDCILDHTLVIVPVERQGASAALPGVQLILWNTKTGFGRPE